MDIYTKFFDLPESADDELSIPEPKAHADLRPNPTPLLNISRLEPVPVEPPVQEPDLESESELANVIKSETFHSQHETITHSAVKATAEMQTPFVERRKDTKEQHCPANSSMESTDAKCYAMMGAGGGTGVTTLCIQLAYDLAKRTQTSSSLGGHTEPTVCLIDLDFETGSCASFLDVPNALEIADICGPASGIDSSIVQALMSQHDCGIAVLSTPNALGANSLANPETVLALLDAASEIYDHIVLDLPRNWQSWIGAAISGANHFALVSELTIPSLHTARLRINNIEKVLGPEQNCEIILNKVERRSFRNSIRLSDAEKALQRNISASICIDNDTTREAINCGEPVGLIRSEARYVKDVRELSLKWAPDKVKSKGFFKDRRKKRLAA